jgi:hypothetical protein
MNLGYVLIYTKIGGLFCVKINSSNGLLKSVGVFFVKL